MARSTAFFTMLVIGATGSAEAQRPIPGFPRSDQSDVAGVVVTASDQLAPLFAEPGTVRTMGCSVAWGVRYAADHAAESLLQYSLPHTISLPGQTMDSRLQLRVLRLLTQSGGWESDFDVLLAALAPDPNRRAEAAARRMLREMTGLFTILQDMDPESPGRGGATRLTRAVSGYNAYIEASADGFLAARPIELNALHSVLNRLVIATLEHESRPADPNSVDQSGIACAPPVPPTPAPPPPPERAIEMCVVVDREFRNVAAILRPETGDTLVMVEGERRPFSEVYPRAFDIEVPQWLALRDPVTIADVQYQPFGVSRRVQPSELTHRGQVGEVDYYASPDEGPVPAVVYFSLGPDCLIQPYRNETTIRVRG